MATTGLVSIVVPCFNAAAYLGDAIRSIRNQTYSELDIIAVDDGSTDNSRQLLEAHAAADPRVRVVSQPNQGLAAARNTGIRQARGEFLCFLDADDVFLPQKLERQVAFLVDHPECDLVYSDSFMGDENLKLTGFVVTCIPEGHLLTEFARRNCFGPSVMATLLRRELADRVGPFDESLRTSEDWDYWIRCAKSGIFGYLPGAVAVYRKHGSQMHRDFRRMFEGTKTVIDKHFQDEPRLCGLAKACFYWAYAKGRFHSHDLLRAFLYLALSEYHSRKVDGVPLSRREIDTIILPVEAGLRCPPARAPHVTSGNTAVAVSSIRNAF